MSRDAGPAGYAPLRGMSEGQRHSAGHAPNGKGSPATRSAPTMPSCSARSKKRQRPVVAGTITICDDNGHGVHTSLQHQPTFHHRGGISTTIDGDVAWAHRFTVAGNGLKVPLAPMPSRCKRARRVRVPVNSTSPTMGGDVGEAGGCGPASSSSGSNCAPRAAEQSFIRPTTPRDQKPTLPANALSPARSNRAVQP